MAVVAKTEEGAYLNQIVTRPANSESASEALEEEEEDTAAPASFLSRGIVSVVLHQQELDKIDASTSTYPAASAASAASSSAPRPLSDDTFPPGMSPGRNDHLHPPLLLPHGTTRRGQSK